MTPRVTALVPMRHESQRVPGKNYRPFAGRPLYHWIVETLLECPRIDAVVIDTDSPLIIENAAVQFPEVRILERPETLRGEAISMNQVLLNSVAQIESDLYLQTHSTNPLLRSDTIDRAVKVFLESRPNHDSLFSVTRVQARLWDQLARPVNHNPAILLRTQDLPPVFEESSSFYLFDAETLRSTGSRIGARPLMFELDPEEAWDIDEELDFRIAEFIHADRNGRA